MTGQRTVWVNLVAIFAAGAFCFAAVGGAAAKDWEVFEIRSFNYPLDDKLPTYTPKTLSQQDSIDPARLDNDGDGLVRAVEQRGLLCIRTTHIENRPQVCINNNHVTTDECRVASGGSRISQEGQTTAGTAGLTADCE